MSEWEEIQRQIILRPYQEPISEKVFNYFRNNKGKHPLVALPTGSGKTIVLCDLVKKAIDSWPETKILVLSHVKEILEQDYKALHNFLDDTSVLGLNSHGLGRRECKPVTVAGIQSIWRNPDVFAEYNLIIIDECHLIPISGRGMYRSFFEGLDNPYYFGLTATPYRLGTGYIYGDDDETIFDDLIYDLTYMDAFNKLIDDGWLSRLRTKATTMELDTAGIRTKAGDFSEKDMSDRFDREQITEAACKEIIKSGENYRKWLIFAIDIDHAEHIAETLLRSGVRAMVVHSKMEMDRDQIIRKYKKGHYKAIVNVNVLTTGFDDPSIDLIALLRPTKSPVIHVQTIGRGLRIAEGKDHCLIMDFAGNTERLGPINDVHIHKKRKGAEGGDPITKRCPVCDTIHHPTVKVCDACGHEFKFKTLLKAQATAVEVVASTKSDWVNVEEVTYSLHTKANSPNSVLVRYKCGLRYFKEWICIEHPGYAGYRAKHWIKFRGIEEVPENSEELLKVVDKLKKPSRIKIDTKGRYPSIADYSF